MKKYYIALCAACLGMAFTACSNDENEVVKNEGAPLTEIFASAKVASRTALAENGVDVTWSAGDAISVIPFTQATPNLAKSVTFVQTGEAGSSSSKFFGKAEDNDNYVAVYPEQKNTKKFSTGGKSYIANVAIPKHQHAVKGGFDPDANLMAASFTKAEAGTVVFKHMCAYAKITIEQPCLSITFTPTGDQNWKVTGNDFYLEYDANDKVRNAHGQSGSVNEYDYAKLIPASGQTEIEAGTYYIAFNPAPAGTSNTTGYPKFVIENTNNTQLTRTSTKKVSFNVSNLGQVIDFGTASVSEGWMLN